MAGPLYADDLVLRSESEDDLRGMIGVFDDICKSRGLKGNAGT